MEFEVATLCWDDKGCGASEEGGEVPSVSRSISKSGSLTQTLNKEEEVPGKKETANLRGVGYARQASPYMRVEIV